MAERSGDQTAKRVFVSVSTKSPCWPEAWAQDKQIVKAAIDLINSASNTAPQTVEADTMLVVKERWPMRIWIVFDIRNTTYDPAKAHLEGQNDLPVIAISFSKTPSMTIASKLVMDRVNRGVRETHDSHGDGSRVPFLIDHANGNIPTFTRPRTRNTATTKKHDE